MGIVTKEKKSRLSFDKGKKIKGIGNKAWGEAKGMLTKGKTGSWDENLYFMYVVNLI